MKRACLVIRIAAVLVAIIVVTVSARVGAKHAATLRSRRNNDPRHSGRSRGSRHQGRKLVRMYYDRIAAYDERHGGPSELVHPCQPARVRPGRLTATTTTIGNKARDAADGVLAGIPMILKDNIDTTDMPTTAGSVAFEGSIPAERCVHHAKTARGRRDHPRQGDDDRVCELPDQRHAGRLQLARRLRLQPVRSAARSTYHARRAAAVQRRPSGADARRIELGTGHRRRRESRRCRNRHGNVRIDFEPRYRERLVGIKPTVGLISRDGIIPITADRTRPVRWRAP